jgi:hypothetical protein
MERQEAYNWEHECFISLHIVEEACLPLEHDCESVKDILQDFGMKISKGNDIKLKPIQSSA